MRYDGVDDETRIGNHVLGDVGLVDWRATKRQESGVGGGWDLELTAWRSDWRSFLVVLIAPAQKRERRHTACGVPLTISLDPMTIRQSRQQVERTAVAPFPEKEGEKMVTRRVGSVVDSITKTEMTAGSQKRENCHFRVALIPRSVCPC